MYYQQPWPPLRHSRLLNALLRYALCVFAHHASSPSSTISFHGKQCNASTDRGPYLHRLTPLKYQPRLYIPPFYSYFLVLGSQGQEVPNVHYLPWNGVHALDGPSSLSTHGPFDRCRCISRSSSTACQFLANSFIWEYFQIDSREVIIILISPINLPYIYKATLINTPELHHRREDLKGVSHPR